LSSSFRIVAALAAGSLALTACKDSPSEPALGPPASIAVASGSATVPANTDVTGLTIVVKDQNGKPVPNQTVTYAVTQGGGSIQTTTSTTGSDGTTVVPTWRLGKRAESQVLRASTGTIFFDIPGTVATGFGLDLRFYGTAFTSDQQAIFQRARDRIRAVVTGDLGNVSTGGEVDISDCLGQPAGTTKINEVIDDLVIYATVAQTGGSGTIASAGPCYYRTASSGRDSITTVIGVMRFSPTFLSQLTTAQLENVILHEMLHVVGIGSWWLGTGCAGCSDPGFNWVRDRETLSPKYVGPNGKAECIALGGTITCASGVPVESDTARGTGLVHWENANFPNELMVGYISSGPMPFSRMTVASLKDINLSVNMENYDAYTVSPLVGGAASAMVLPASLHPNWERPLTSPLYGIDPQGRIREVRMRR